MESYEKSGKSRIKFVRLMIESKNVLQSLRYLKGDFKIGSFLFLPVKRLIAVSKRISVNCKISDELKGKFNSELILVSFYFIKGSNRTSEGSTVLGREAF